MYCLLELEEVQAFMRTLAYQERKAQRFRHGDDQAIARNPAFLLADADQRQRFAQEYRKTAALYYQGSSTSRCCWTGSINTSTLRRKNSHSGRRFWPRLKQRQ